MGQSYTFQPKLNHPNNSVQKSQINKSTSSQVKCEGLLTIFFDCKDVVHHEFLSQGRMVNKKYYFEIIRRLREAMLQKRTELWKNQSWILHYDNAPAHTTIFVPEFLAKNKTVIMFQPPYLQDLAAADFFLFPKLNAPVKGERFATIGEIKEKSKRELLVIPKSTFQKCFEDQKERWHKCIISEERNFEGDKIVIDK